MNTISVKDLAVELGQSVMAVSQQVSALCRAWGPQRVVAQAAVSNGGSLLFSEAAEQIRSVFELTPAGAA